MPIFATPFGVVPIEDAETLNALLTPLFAARASSGGHESNSASSSAIAAGGAATSLNGLCYHSGDDLLDWPDEPVRRLSSAMRGGVYSVVQAVNDFTDAQLRAFRLEARAWFSIVKQHGRVPATQYPMTAWCAIYCVAAPPPSATRADSGMLRFYESRLGTMFQDATNALMRIPYKQGHYGWRPVQGQMAVFPATLTHEIALLNSPGELVLVTMRSRFVGEHQQGFARW